MLKVCLAVWQVSLSVPPPGNTSRPAPRLSSTAGPEPVPCCPLTQKQRLSWGSARWAGRTHLPTHLPRGSHTRTASTGRRGKCCGTTWRGPARLKRRPCRWGRAAGPFPGTHNPTRRQRRSSAASCCLHLPQTEREQINRSKHKSAHMSAVLLILPPIYAHL